MIRRPVPSRRSAPSCGLRPRLLLGSLLVVLSTAAAAADARGEVTWSVQPADEAGPDGRPWIEQDLDPGESVVEHLAVHNFSDHEVAFGLAAADGFFNEDGRFNILPAGQTSTAAGTWIDLVGSVTVPAGGTAVVPFTITVPADAEPGDHAAGVAASVVSTSTGAGGASVGVQSRVGFRVMTRVTGTLAPGATIENVRSSYRPSWNPFAPGDLVVEFDVRQHREHPAAGDRSRHLGWSHGDVPPDGPTTRAARRGHPTLLRRRRRRLAVGPGPGVDHRGPSGRRRER